MTVKTPTQLKADIIVDFPDNTTGLITPSIMRTFQDDIVDSYSGGDLSSAVVTSTGSTTARSLATRFSNVVNVKDYGAKGDAITDDSVAIQNSVNAAAVLVNNGIKAAVYFPAGVYKITQDAVLTQNTTVALAGGVHYYGDGGKISILRLAPSGSDIYFYNNGATARMQFNTFADLGFQGMDPAAFTTFTDIPVNSKGFRQWGTGHEQNFKFTRCWFSYLNSVFTTTGTNDCDENSWFQCEITFIRTNVLIVDNPESINFEFHGTNLSLIYGDCFSITANGGGAIKMYGGDVILEDSGAPTYFLNGHGGLGLNNYPFTFNGLRIELHGNNTNLVSFDNRVVVAVQFNNCAFDDQATATKPNWCIAQEWNNIHFANCTFNEQNGFQIQFIAGGATFTTVEEYGSIIFEKCGLSQDWSDRCSLGASNAGVISAKNCHNIEVGTVSNFNSYWATDFDLNWNEATVGIYSSWTTVNVATGALGTASPSNNHRRLKTATLKNPLDNWPTSQENTLKLPKNALIKSIHLRKPAGGSDGTVTTYNVGRNDKSGTPHLTTASQAWNLAVAGDTTNYFYHVGATVNERTLRLYCNPLNFGPPYQIVEGGFVYVEYY